MRIYKDRILAFVRKTKYAEQKNIKFTLELERSKL